MRIAQTIIFFLLILSIGCNGQSYFEKRKPHPYFFSPEINYNTSLQEYGLGARLERNVLKRFRIGINANYLTKINYSKDFYVGIRSSYWLLKSERKFAYRKYTYDSNRPDLYVFGQLDHNWYLLESENKQISITPFLGIGSSYGKSYLKYFAEIKYNIAFNETWMSAGVTANMFGFKNRKNNPL
jgi:hypothetical protein